MEITITVEQVKTELTKNMISESIDILKAIYSRTLKLILKESTLRISSLCDNSNANEVFQPPKRSLTENFLTFAKSIKQYQS